MSFDYTVPTQNSYETTTFGSKVVLAKSAKIDIAAGSGGATATDYDLGFTLPKGAQPILVTLQVNTALSGGTVSAATIAIKSGSTSIYSNLNVFATGSFLGLNSNANGSLSTILASDQRYSYNLTLTGTGPATAGVFWVTVFYVM